MFASRSSVTNVSMSMFLLLGLLLAACMPVQAMSMPVNQSVKTQSIQTEEMDEQAMWYELDDLKMYYEVHGEGQPILLLHGLPNDHNVMVSAFEPVFQEREGWQRIYVDLPGMGQTSGGSWLAGNDDVLAVLTQFMDDLYPDERFLVVGFSYGGYLARGVLHEKQAQMDGLFLLAPSVPGHRVERIVPPHITIVPNPEGLAQFPAPFDQFLGTVLVVQDDAVLAQQGDIITGFQNADQEALDRIEQRRAFSFPVDYLPEPFAQPVLIITGKHDSVVGYEQAGDLLQFYPRATYAVLDRAGHGVHMEQPTIFRLLVNEWLDRVEESQEMAQKADEES